MMPRCGVRGWMLAGLGLLSPTAASAQCVEGCEVVTVLEGEAVGDTYGWKSNAVGDLDADGVPDFAITAPFHDTDVGLDAGKVYAYSGADSRLLFAFAGEGPNWQLGTDVNEAGDVDADGVPDIIAGGPVAGAGRAAVYSGRDGSRLQLLEGEAPNDRYGFRVAGGGDLNGDGRPDLLVSARTYDPEGRVDAGRVYVYSGVDYALLAIFDGEAAGDELGSGLANAGDLDGDGRSEILVGARGAGPANGGLALVLGYDGSDRLRVVHRLAPTQFAVDYGLFFVDGRGDTNCDGVPDLYVGDFSANRAYLYSGTDASLLHVFTGDNRGGGFGLGEVIDDVDGDGAADLILAAWVSGVVAQQAGKVFVYSGAGGRLLRTYTHDIPFAQFGFDANGLGDVTGDGLSDYLVTAANDRRGRGVAYVIAGDVPRSGTGSCAVEAPAAR